MLTLNEITMAVWIMAFPTGVYKFSYALSVAASKRGS